MDPHPAADHGLHHDPFDELTDAGLADRFDALLAQQQAARGEPTVAISLRLPVSVRARFQERAAAAGIPYQTLIKAALARFLDDMNAATLPRVSLTLDAAALEQLRTTGLDVVLTAG